MPDYTQGLIRVWREASFALDLYDTGRTDSRGRARLAYRFWHENNLIFSGDDFFPSPLHAIDSDDTLASLLGFLSVRPGDTDPEYFENYTPIQIEFAEHHAEELSLYVYEMEHPDGD